MKPLVITTLVAILTIVCVTKGFSQDAQTYHAGSILLDNGNGSPVLVTPPSTGGLGQQTFQWPSVGGTIVTNTYLTTQLATYLPLAGGTLTGPLKTAQILLATGHAAAASPGITIPNVSAFVIDAGGTDTADFAITLPTAVEGKILFIKNEDVTHNATNTAGNIPHGVSALYIVVAGVWHLFPGIGSVAVS